ncbi:MAG: hypothetical protein SF066_10085 [Thermoanaerobaculia bacterium]|nr:hypothetical protein [Thermoanaerobaculia bacterium]
MLRAGIRAASAVMIGVSLLLGAPALRAQDDLEKPLAPECAGDETARVVPEYPAVELDLDFDFANPLLGLTPPAEGERATAEKAAGEVCNTPEARVAPDEPYDKADEDPGVALAPCAFPAYQSVPAGVRDRFAQPQDPANLTPAIMNAVGVLDPSRWVGFDQPGANYHFGHEFQLTFFPTYGYQGGLLTLHLQPFQDIAENDTISLWSGTAPGWSGRLVDLVQLVPGHEAILQLDLRNLRSQGGASTILADINQFQDLKVYIQDDTAVDDMTLELSCSVLQPDPIVGVIMGPRGCGAMDAYDVFLDNEDKKNANGRGGWIGATISNKNTQFRLCATDGNQFTPAAEAGANFALVSLSSACPNGFTRFDRYHDNEDNNAASWDNLPSGSPTTTTQPKKNTNMAFCVATGKVTTVPNSRFPDLGVIYGVFGGRNRTTWALERGWLFLDDEDKNNQNAPAGPPAYTWEFLEPGKNTTYFLSRVK